MVGCGRIDFDPLGGSDREVPADSLPASFPDTTDGAAPARWYLKASNTDGADLFGTGIEISADGTTLVVSAPGEASAARGIDGDQADDTGASTGAVYVFVRSGTTWIQQAYLKASNADAGDAFGETIALSADGATLAVGADREASAATGVNGNQASNAAAGAGAVYVFNRSGGVWTQEAYLKASNTGANDWFGNRIALAGDGATLVVGAPKEDSAATGINGDQASNALNAAGAAYVFVRNGGVWTQQAYLKASNPGSVDDFGEAVTISGDGNTIALASPLEDSAATGVNGDQTSNAAGGAGAVYVFTRTGSVWSQQAYVKASNAGGGDLFGGSIALSPDGETLAVGAWGEASAATGIDGNQADNTAAMAGSVYVFNRNGGTWAQQAYLKPSNTGANDSFGIGLAFDTLGARLVASAWFEDSAAVGLDGDGADNSVNAAGAVYVFDRFGTTWSQTAYVKAYNTGAQDQFGFGIAVTGDGQLFAVSAPGEASAATGIDGDQLDDSAGNAGAAYVFTLDDL